MRIATALEVERFWDAPETRHGYLPLLPRSPLTSRKGTAPAEIIRTTDEFLREWLPSINVREVRDLLEGLEIGLAIIPDAAIEAGYVVDSGIIVMRRGFIEFIRHRAAVNVLTAALARMKRLAVSADGTDPVALSEIGAMLDGVLENIEAKSFELALKNCVDADPLGGLLTGELAKRRDVVANGMLIFAILHEYGHAVVRRKPLPAVPPSFDQALIFPVKEENRLDQYEEHMADALACQAVPAYAIPWVVSAATVFFGVHIVFEDLCYDNQSDHPRAANRIALLLHYTDIADRLKTECQAMVELGDAVAERRRRLGRETEPLADRRRRTELYVQAHNPDLDAKRLVEVLSDVYSLEEDHSKGSRL